MSFVINPPSYLKGKGNFGLFTLDSLAWHRREDFFFEEEVVT